MNIRLYIVLFFTIITAALSCKNKDYPLPTLPTAPLAIINATSNTLNYYINGTRKNNTSSLYPGGATVYIPVPFGQQNYEFKKSGNANVLFTVGFSTDTGKYYSMFLTGETSDGVFECTDPLDSVGTILRADTTFSKSMIRFVNASTDTSALDFATTGSDTISVKNYPFKHIGSFIQIRGGTLSIKIYPTGKTTPTLDTALTLQTGGVYTLFTKGKLNGKGVSKFSLGLMANGNY